MLVAGHSSELMHISNYRGNVEVLWSFLLELLKGADSFGRCAPDRERADAASVL